MITEITNKTHGCRQTKNARVCVPKYLSSTGKSHWANKPIDICLVRLVKALNDIDIKTASCCCGHGVVEGTIILHDKITITIPRCKTHDS